MADLDDFFAKKDRKKAKKKFATADEIVKKLEDTGRKVDKTSKKDRSNPDGDDTGLENHEQDEWKDFEEEKKDYSGLKIGHLSLNTDGNTGLSSSEGQTGDTSGLGDGGSDSGSISGDVSGTQNEGGATKGPWKRVQQPTQPEIVEQSSSQPPQPTQSESKPTGYVPPHLRGNRANTSSAQSSRQRNKAAPDIHNEEYFPTLSSTKPDSTSAWGKKSNKNEGIFEEVRHNKASFGRQAAEQRANQGNGQGVKLNLGNRYNTLSSTNDS